MAVTDTALDNLAAGLNRLLSRPMLHSRWEGDKEFYNVGHLFISKANRSYALLMTNSSGEHVNVFGNGYIAKNQFYLLLNGFAHGVRAGIEANQKENARGKKDDPALRGSERLEELPDGDGELE